MSDVSASDFEVFASVANPDFSSADVNNRKPSVRAPPRLETIDDEEEEDEEEKRRRGSDDDDKSSAASSSSSASTRRPTRHRADDTVREQYDEDDDNRTHVSSARGSRRGAFAEYLNKTPARVKTRDQVHNESLEKQSMIADLERLRDHHGITLSREWCMDDDIDDMSFELKRIMLHIDEENQVGVMRNGLQLACTAVEMASKRFKILDLDGWSAEVCSDMSKHDRALAKLYRKYWRRSHSSSPEADIAMSLVTSMGMFHMKKTVTKRMFQPRSGGGGGGEGRASAPPPSRSRPTIREVDEDDEDLPPIV